jgi:hypothetical protein
MKKQNWLLGTILLFSVLGCFIRPTTAIGFWGASHSMHEGVYAEHAFGGLIFRTEYQASADFLNWKVTGNKAVDLKLGCLANPDNASILIEHMHADVIIESTKTGFDEITQDSMDDEFHGIQGGFFVNGTYSYYETFSIEGSSPTFQQSCGWVYENYYSGSLKTFKFSEEDLINSYGVYGTSLYVVYDVLVRYEGEEFFHKFIVTDNIFIDVNGIVKDNTGNLADQPASDIIPGFPLLIVGLFTIIPIGFLIRKKMKNIHKI